jgi:hypothetical protein
MLLLPVDHRIILRLHRKQTDVRFRRTMFSEITLSVESVDALCSDLMPGVCCTCSVLDNDNEEVPEWTIHWIASTRV